MCTSLHVATYNCRGMRIHRRSTSVENFYINDVLNRCDLLLLQETFMYKEDLPLLNSYHDEFHGTGEAVLSTSSGPHSGRPRGGVAIMWRKTVEFRITELKFNLDWVVGVQISYQDGSDISILCIYLPYCCDDNEVEFLIKLNMLLDISHELESGNIAIIGDFNANIGPNRSAFGTYLLEFCDEHNFSLISQKNLPPDSYTFSNDYWNSQSWLDHIVCSPRLEHCISIYLLTMISVKMIIYQYFFASKLTILVK